MIWLLDVGRRGVAGRRPPDGAGGGDRRRGDGDGERPACAGASVSVSVDGAVVASGVTDESGGFGFATPSHLDDDAFVVTVAAPGTNVRHLRLDGTEDVVDLRAASTGRRRRRARADRSGSPWSAHQVQVVGGGQVEPRWRRVGGGGVQAGEVYFTRWASWATAGLRRQ